MKHRADFMTADQKAKWEVAEEREGRVIPRTHYNCIAILKVARPGKTAKDKGH